MRRDIEKTKQVHRKVGIDRNKERQEEKKRQGEMKTCRDKVIQGDTRISILTINCIVFLKKTVYF